MRGPPGGVKTGVGRTAMPRAIVYRRVSTEEQAESGAGLAAQLDACNVWCARNGFEAAGPFDDEAVGGATELHQRPGLVAACSALAKGDVLLVAKRDRLGRDPLVIAMVEAAVARRKGRVASAAGEGTSGDGPADVLMRRVVDAFAEYERLIIKARTRGALAAKKARGERCGRVPYGKAVVDDGRRSKVRADGTGGLPIGLADHPGEQRVLAAIFDLRRKGWACDRIAWALNQRGIPTKALRPWQASSVHYLCRAHGVEKGSPSDPNPQPPTPIPHADDTPPPLPPLAPPGPAPAAGRPAP